ncbi:MAG TPA: hypothetical protein VN516_03390, partial [Candidatus Baltobacteraceae bacterium]|nr:hypothetical protein [Candidatus Baltobacteraceae bacterium]
MKKFLTQLRSMERRLAVGVLVLLILVLNWVFIWPHFSDFGKLRQRMTVAQQALDLRQKAIAETEKYQSLVKQFESAGQFVAPEDQAIAFLQTIKLQAAASGVGIVQIARSSTRTNQFFTEQSQGITA